MKHFTDSLLKDFLLEASYSEQEVKMDLWHNGQRKQNIGACSDDKLKINFDICVRKGYDHEALLLRDEAQDRGLWWKDAPISNQIPSTSGFLKVPTMPSSGAMNTGTATQVTLVPLTADDFELDFAEQVKQNASNRKELRELCTSLQKTLVALVIAIVLKETDAMAILKEKLLEWPVDKAEINTVLLGCAVEPIKSKLQDIATSISFMSPTQPAVQPTAQSATLTPSNYNITNNAKPNTTCFIVRAYGDGPSKPRRQLKFRKPLPGTKIYNIAVEGAENDSPEDCRVLFTSVQQATDFINKLDRANTVRPIKSFRYVIGTFGDHTFDFSLLSPVDTVCGPAHMLNSCMFKESLNLKEAIEKHETLNTKLWTNKAILKDEVKEKIEAIVTEFISGLAQDGVKIVVKDIILIGSNCSYNYTDMSDLDIHIVADTSELQCQENVYPALYGAYRSLFSRKFDIDFYGIPVELYVETEETKTISNGVYSVLNNTWIKEPVKEAIPNIDTKTFEVDFQKWELAYNKVMKKSEDLLDEPKKNLEKELEQKIKDVETTDLDHVLNTLETEVEEKAEEVGIQKEESKEGPIQTTMPETTMQLQIEQFINDLYTLRKYGLATDGEYSTGNLVFKEMRNKGYLDALKTLKNKLVAQSLSLKDVEKPIKNSLGESVLENDPLRALRDYKIKIERIVHNQAVVQPNGRFQVYLVKETDVQEYVNELKRLENVEKVSALPSGKYDFSHVGVNKIPHRYFTISGIINF